MVISKPDSTPATVATNNMAAAGAATGTPVALDAAGANSLAHPSGIPQDQIDNILSGIANTGDVKMNNHRKKLRQRFDIIKKLGQGTYGKVQLGINKETSEEVAIKTIKKCKIEAEADLVRIRREVQIMSSVQHPNIIHIYEVFENREKMVLVMEFAAGGELYDYLSERKVLSEEEARRIFRQVATAVYYCHKHKICHRDLKLENILLDEQGNAKIADFGLSNVFDDQRLLGTFCGSPLYASPEIVEGTPYQGPEVDCWSLGVLLYTLVYGSMPFDGSNFKRLVKQISQGDYYEPRKPSRASTLIREMLTVCPRKRATIEQICAHWWVNENDNVSCLDLAEDLANQTPVRLDVLLSLTPAAVTADQLVVPSADGAAAAAAKAANERVPRSHSVGSIRDIGAPNTEAERRILDMVAAGGEAALMPSPTRTITPAQSPVQTKRKLQSTVSTENAAGTTAKKKEKPSNSSFVISESTAPLTEETPMEAESAFVDEPTSMPAAQLSANYSKQDLLQVGDLCDQLLQNNSEVAATAAPAAAPSQVAASAAVPRQSTRAKLDAVVETPEEKDATKVIKKFVNKHKTADLVNAIAANSGDNNAQSANNKSTTAATTSTAPAFVRKCSLQDESTLNKFNADRRKSRILETAEKFQQMGPAPTPVAVDKSKKPNVSGVSVGSFKKEFERKASNATPVAGPTPGERRALEQVAAAAAAAQEAEADALVTPPASPGTAAPDVAQSLESSDSKNSVASLSLDEARRSMENSIALLRQAQNESNKELDQLCAQTETIGVSEPTEADRERKLKNARTIIGNAIQPVIRRPTPLYGNGNVSGNGSVVMGGGGYAQMRAKSGSHFMNNARPEPPAAVATMPPPLLLTPSALAAAKQTIQQRLFAGGVPQFNLPLQQQQQHQQPQQPAKRPATWQPQAAYSTASIFQPGPTATTATAGNNSSFKMLQQQYQQRCQDTEELQQQQQQQQKQQRPFSQGSSALFTPPPSPLKAHAHAPYAHAYNHNNNIYNEYNNSNNSYYHTMPNVNYQVNSRTRPFHNQAQDTLNTNATNITRTTTSTTATSSSALPAAIWLKSSPGGDPNAPGAVKTSTASITLKSATLPRRKINAKSEVQLDIKPRIVEQPAMRFTTEMQHPVADLRSAPPREGPIPYSPIKTSLHTRATSLEPKEHIIPVQRPPQHAYARTVSNTTNRSGSLSRQSTLESESDATTTNLSQSTLTGGMSMSGAPAQPIKKSPREFIIPIAVEGGGFITPRERSIEPSESSHTTASSRTTFSRLRPSRGIGSLLSEAGFDEGSPFQKMRNTSITRDGGDDDVRFTPHILRSSRPVKKISQDNDSQSSGEEDDDDDGFEILTAENLFSTLLQRVRALTNRLNVNSDLTTGFPSHSSRLLTDISRQAQNSPFWSRGSAFGSRLNSGSNSSGLGAPWRHSMSRDLGSDMDSMFSRTGATLPRGHAKNSSKKSELNSAIAEEAAKAVTAAATGSTEEPLDLADLDLSRLRLSKKDLETLSSITPGLPKCFQEQLLAKLPPTQARKLSRTLSVQTSGPSVPAVKVYKRSQSSGRGYLAEETQQEARQEAQQETQQPPKQPPLTDAPKTTAASTAIYRRSLSRSRYEGESSIPAPPSLDSSNKSRSSSVCRDDYAKSSLCNSSYTSDINDKYKYYSPYLSKSSNAETTGLQKRYSAALGRPPSGCLSPPPTQANTMPISDGTSSLRRRSTQRRISRFLRPDFFDEPATPSAGDENAYQRERRQRERETQSVLREIREKSCERQSQESTELRRRKHSLPNVEAEQHSKSTRHARNKSMEMFADEQTKKEEASKSLKRRSLSRPRDIETELDKHQLADKILQELQLLSAVRTQHEKRLSNELVATEEAAKNDKTEQSYSEQTATIKKIKKVKPKEKSQESSTDADNTLTNTTSTTTLVRKVKKVVKKSDGIKTPTGESVPTLSTANEQLKETKIKRPKSYPMKDVGLSLKNADVPECAPTALPSKLPSKLPTASMALVEPNVDNNATGSLRESRLIRPKSYPATKLSTPKELKKITRSGVAIPSIAETAPAASFKSGSSTSRQSTSEEKSLSATPTGNSAPNEKDSSSSSESRPTTIKKIIKISKKSKLVPPTPVTPTTPTTTTTSVSPAESSKESSPVIKAKEKSPEKKPSKGLLYAIGQKFEKLRDSAMSKEKKAAQAAASMPNTPSSAINSSCRELQSPEKVTMLRKKKSLDGEKQLNEAVITTSGAEGAATEKRNDKRSRFDTMLRSLRERSVPRAQSNAKEKSEASALKRAASVENLDGGKQGGAMNKMLGGLFRRFDRESSEQRRVRSTRSTSNIERQIREETPTSPIYQNAATIASVKAAKSKANIEENCNCETACPDCIQNQTIKQPKELTTITQSNKEKRKGLMLDLTKLERLDNVSANPTSTTGGAASTTTTSSSYRSAKTNSTLINGNGLYSNLPPYPGAIKSASNNSSSQQSMDNVTNNNSINTNNNSSSMHTSQTSGYRTSSAHEINRNAVQTPSFENIANYSSDSRSYQDDCASTSTFLSPTEEPELYFDNWSICSEDNYMLHATPSPTVSRLSRASQLSSPTRCSESSDPNESVIDRIKRRSFYSRFNEQKPRRTSSIVGPVAVRDFYREQQAAVKARSSHKLHAEVNTRAHSPDITQQFFRPLKLSPVGTELKPPVYRSPLDYSASSVSSKPRKSLNDIRTNTSPSFLSKRYGSSSMDQHDYNSTLSSTVPMRYKSSSSSSPSNGAVGGTAATNYYNTYNPKRRSSYTLNGSVPTGSGSSAATSSHIDGYATLGRRSIRPYDHRTMSLLEPPTNSSAGSSSAYHRREARTPVRDYTSSITRSGSRYRTSSATRSPTNI